MKGSIILLAMLVSMMCIQGCNYGKEVLYVINSETISLIERPSGSASKKILEANQEKGWFFIPQFMSLSHRDKAWLAVRVYSRNPDLNYEISRIEISSPKGIAIEGDDLKLGSGNWYPVEGGWFYQVVKVKSYSYASLMSSGIRSINVSFELIVNGVIQRDQFDLEIQKIRRSGW